ncbi:SCP2 sterol-binding domain-containing protein [Bradyrhizobium sp. Ai1a-2]|uniref:ubiquinone anaerobic biosynthesis accessory factor UbiT n=1 Tax=Bradyrhizobium sp. Ai1a-2 TaxID=196490 RepID=UPI001268ED70|nr:SCP2 sterol-binding domain-containing protein [Bradyrhizobium sp. Ai1a-2]
MNFSEVTPPASSPLSVPPLLALAVRPLPLLPLEAVLSIVLLRVCREHPRIFDRLGVHAGKRFGIKPTDLPFAFLLAPAPPRPRLSVVRNLPNDLDARISSPLAGLFGLVEGRLDGDALLFSRDLVVEGDVEAVLALRNAIDDAQVDPMAEIAGMFGPLAEPLKRALQVARTVVSSSNPSHKGI